MSRFEGIRGGVLQRGFSYLWLLLLVGFMGLSLVLAVEVDSTSVQRDKERELLSIGRQFRTAIGRYYESSSTAGKREYPATLQDLLRDNRVPGTRRHLRRIFVDPMTGKAEWGLVKVGGRIVGVHSLSDKAPIKQEGFEAEDSNLRGKKQYAEWVFAYPFDLIVASEQGDNLSSRLGPPDVNSQNPKEASRQ